MYGEYDDFFELFFVDIGEFIDMKTSTPFFIFA